MHENKKVTGYTVAHSRSSNANIFIIATFMAVCLSGWRSLTLLSLEWVWFTFSFWKLVLCIYVQPLKGGSHWDIATCPYWRGVLDSGVFSRVVGLQMVSFIQRCPISRGSLYTLH